MDHQRPSSENLKSLRMYLVSCSYGISFAVTADYDRRGSNLEAVPGLSRLRQASRSQELPARTRLSRRVLGGGEMLEVRSLLSMTGKYH